jgi:hypothetical protein
LALLRLPIAPAILRTRAGYQTALGSGRTAMEVAPGGPIDGEVGALWRFLAAA